MSHNTPPISVRVVAITVIIAITGIAAIGRITATATDTSHAPTMVAVMADTPGHITAVAMVIAVRASRSASAVAAAGNKKARSNAGFSYEARDALRASLVSPRGAFWLAAEIWSGRRESNPRM